MSGVITKDGLSKSNVDRCGICSVRVKANHVFCVQCGMWTHRGCAAVKSDHNVARKKNLKEILEWQRR